MIKGETVVLFVKTQSGTDGFGVPTYTTTQESIGNVIVGSPSFETAIQELNLTGRRLAFILGIPKGDAHDWEDKDVLIRGEKFRTYGPPLLQTAENVPGPWNLQVKVERYE